MRKHQPAGYKVGRHAAEARITLNQVISEITAFMAENPADPVAFHTLMWHVVRELRRAGLELDEILTVVRERNARNPTRQPPPE